MFVRVLGLAALATADVLAAPPDAPTEDDVQLLATGLRSLSDEDILPMAPEMAMVQVDVAESIMAAFQSFKDASKTTKDAEVVAKAPVSQHEPAATAAAPVAMMQLAPGQTSLEQDNAKLAEVADVTTQSSPAKAFRPGNESMMLANTAELSFSDRFVQQFVAELELPKDAPARDKRTLAILTTLVLPTFFGIDRCFLGQYILGTLKGMTFGGCAVWALFDWCYITYNCLLEYPMMDSLSFHAKFSEESVKPSFFIALVGVLVFCGFCVQRDVPTRRDNKV